jgi:hypothetical protein
MEWTIEHHVFMGKEFFTISTPIENGKHTMLAEYTEQRGGGVWRVRDACDRGQHERSLIKAFISYIDRSREANRSKVGHCGWMIDVGLPALEKGKFELVNTMLSAYMKQHQGVN